MTYFPKSQIKTNLFTNGNEYVLSTNLTYYKGYYYEVSTGQRFTGRQPGDGENILLTIPLSPDSILSPNSTTPTNKNITLNLYKYDEPEDSFNDFSPLKYSEQTGQVNLPQRSLPPSSITLPTPQDYKNGRMIRYFAKKTNELRYLEISKQTYTDLNSRSSNIAWDLYEPVQIQWIISGFEKQQVNDYNTIIVRDIERKKKWYGFSKFLKEDYTKYYKNLSA